MANIFLNSDEQGIVVFKVWQSLSYGKRMLLSFGLIFLGFLLQYWIFHVFPGVLFVIAGNLFLLVSGYDNRINYGSYDPSAKWERVEKAKLLELERLDKKMKKWDASAVDITNGLGGCTFILVLGVTFGTLFLGFSIDNTILKIIGADIGVLLIPHWLTGVKQILTKPRLMKKIELMKELAMEVETQIKDAKFQFLMQLKGKDVPLPDDVKFKLEFENQKPNFLGFYGQTVINMVKSTAYPYFYVVLVARKGYGLDEVYRNFHLKDDKITKEFKVEGEVEVMVIRQTTTETSGYHTKMKDVRRIFWEGYNLAKKVAVA